eukprot:gnl/MRDRNA2_/MRDRNA2_99586_c0_seq1.p1 gnl/MRDRNA2_/MRDRNA2_99586_c0~~gnl/MRDRNA2_/MRDRNA2_99586_c0_seq1.p1  ORF type:complete len:483 (-),score=75.96 gnl/MRDRNA2_/MRDRNA2_99586_c0_seq1:27-1394(-)
MAQLVAAFFLLVNAAFSALVQEDLGGPLTSEEVSSEGHVLLQHKASEIESVNHTEESAGITVDSEDSDVLQGMDKPEEPEDPELAVEEPVVHDLSDHDTEYDALSEEDRLALAELQKADPGPLPNLTETSLTGMEAFGDVTDKIVTAPEDQGETSNVVNDPGDSSYTESTEDIKKEEDQVQLVSYGAEDADVDGYDDGYQDLSSANGTVSGLEVYHGIRPETGEKIPSFANSFPGCGCDFQEYNKMWTCRGTIAAPKSVSGKKCCCCTMNCDRRSRCDHETCDAIGIDQRAEVEAWEKARKKRLGDADALYCDTKMYRVPVGPGRCSNSRNLAACRKIGKYPLCDHSAYAGRGKQCYFPRGKKPCEGRHFSHVGHLRSSHFNPMEFYGMCFVTNNGDHTLIPHAEGHTWNNHGGNYQFNDPGQVNRQVASYPVAEIDNQRAVGGWHTYCVNESPN